VPVTESTIIITTWVACVHGGGQPAGPVSHAVISHLTTQRRVVIASSTTDIKLHTLNSWREMDRWKRICASGIADARRSCVSLSLSLSLSLVVSVCAYYIATKTHAMRAALTPRSLRTKCIVQISLLWSEATTARGKLSFILLTANV